MKRKELFKYPFTIIMSGFIILFSILFLVKKDTDFSELENRTLAGRPDFTISGFLDSSFSSQYELYINEQFPWRTGWVTIKAAAESTLGKIENNGIMKGKNGYLFNKVIHNEKQAEKNVNAILDFGKKVDSNLLVSIVPNSYGVLEEYLPKKVPLLNQNLILKQYQDKIQGVSGIEFLNLFDVLKEHHTEDIYYRTDHHWTTLGAYYAYDAYCRKKGFSHKKIEDFSPILVENFYGTYYSKYKGIHIKPDTICYYDIPIKKMKIGKEEKDSLYDLSKVTVHDKYALFLYGNQPFTIIESKPEKGKKEKLLVIKDSYANSLIPFLTEQYKTIYVIDLRYYKESVLKLIQKENIKNIWLIYNFDTFIEDNHFYKLMK